MNSITVRGYKISYGEDGEHKFTELPEEICKEICDCKDNGERYSISSRYQYSIPKLDSHKGIRFGTANAVIQTLLMKQKDFSYSEHRVTITKIVTS